MKVSATLVSIAAIVSSTVVSAAPLIQPRQFSAETYNQLTDGTPCRPVTVIYARGTGQRGNIGDPAAVGPLMFNELSALLGGTDKLAIQGVTYAANVLGFLLGGDPNGINTMASLTATAVSQCPNTKIILSGYSQGAQVVHKAIEQLSAQVAGKISAVLTLGDPYQKRALPNVPASKWRVICHQGDNICEGGIIVSEPHTNYQLDAKDAAAWMASMVA